MLASRPAIDAFLNGIVHRLYVRAAETGSADFGTMVVDDPAKVDEILKSPDRFRKNFSMISVLGGNRFNANGHEWRCRRNLTQPSYVQAANSENRDEIYAIYEARLAACHAPTPDGIQRAFLTAATAVFF